MFDDEGATVFRDVIMLALLGFVAIVILLLPHINPPREKDDAEIDSPGRVIVELTWPDNHPADVDLWVRAPGERPVGYSNRSSQIFNLLRDDRGFINDEGNSNFEVSFSRGTSAGEYAVTVHLYALHGGPLPLSVHSSITVRNVHGSTQLVKSTQVTFGNYGEELTVARFRLDDDGALVPRSVNAAPINLRSVSDLRSEYGR